jgi:beta-lactamase superfamily II metal-dependent hydrolase
MGDELLVRVYNVGVGDCVYVRIPGGDDGFHILIDCGTIGSITLLKNALDDLRTNLPAGSAAGKKRLDLVVVTHRHRDHIKGFDPKFFEDVEIKNLWLSAAMDPKHPQAEKTRGLTAFTTTAMREVEAAGLALSPQLEMLVSLYGISNDGAMDALRETLPQQNGIEPKYVHAGQTSRDLGVRPEGATLRVLGPEQDIDGFYLGQDADEALRALQGASATIAGSSAELTAASVPINVSFDDFQRLRSRMLSSALAFAETESSLQNNTSVVLLIEWRKRRLLFAGDAEWEGEFRQGKHNGSWNVMWNRQKRHLNKPVDFLKIGHHGSFNATPWNGSQPDHEVNRILDAILPAKPGVEPTARAIASTLRTSVYEPIPRAAMLAELGRRVVNTRRYFRDMKKAGLVPEQLPLYAEYEAGSLDEPQPQRTDLEKLLSGNDWVDVEIPPG